MHRRPLQGLALVLVGVACSIEPPPSQYFPGFFKPRTKGAKNGG
jgi:hypothetical protein